jgi:hypothetical protein
LGLLVVVAVKTASSAKPRSALSQTEATRAGLPQGRRTIRRSSANLALEAVKTDCARYGDSFARR